MIFYLAEWRRWANAWWWMVVDNRKELHEVLHVKSAVTTSEAGRLRFRGNRWIANEAHQETNHRRTIMLLDNLIID